MVEPTHLKHISQIGNLPQIGVKIKNLKKNHHLEKNIANLPTILRGYVGEDRVPFPSIFKCKLAISFRKGNLKCYDVPCYLYHKLAGLFGFFHPPPTNIYIYIFIYIYMYIFRVIRFPHSVFFGRTFHPKIQRSKKVFDGQDSPAILWDPGQSYCCLHYLRQKGSHKPIVFMYWIFTYTFTIKINQM